MKNFEIQPDWLEYTQNITVAYHMNKPSGLILEMKHPKYGRIFRAISTRDAQDYNDPKHCREWLASEMAAA